MSLWNFVGPHLKRISPYVPGKPIEEVEREYGIPDCVKLASNENCLGSSPLALEAGRRALEGGVELYPDGGSHYLRARLAERLSVPIEEVFVGSGTTEIIQLLAQALGGPRNPVLYSDGSFVMYRIAVLAAGGEGVAVPLDRGLGHDLRAMAEALGPSTHLVFIANPNNPTGTWVGRDELRDFLDRVPKTVLVVVDEAYCEYVSEPDYPDALSERGRRPNVMVLRTFSKIHGLAGMRVGYAIGPREIVEALDRLRSPFNISSLGQAMALAALDDRAHQERSREHNRRELAYLSEALAGRGIGFTPSVANFLLVDVGRDASEAFAALLRQGVITRPVAGFPTSLRVSVGTRAGNDRFLRALAALGL